MEKFVFGFRRPIVLLVSIAFLAPIGTIFSWAGIAGLLTRYPPVRINRRLATPEESTVGWIIAMLLGLGVLAFAILILIAEYRQRVEIEGDDLRYFVIKREPKVRTKLSRINEVRELNDKGSTLMVRTQDGNFPISRDIRNFARLKSILDKRSSE